MSQRLNLRNLIMVVMVALSTALPVQANAPPGQYDNTMGPGTVYDTKTGLTWQKTAPDDVYTWENAKSYCMNLNLNGSDWRLPTVKELLTLVDLTKVEPSIDTSASAFPGAPAYTFWSATPFAGSATLAWRVIFYIGFAAVDDVGQTMPVRCVR